jgi:MarR family transcriptional regulator for hemolysin
MSSTSRRVRKPPAGTGRSTRTMPIGVLLHDVARLRRQLFDAETRPLGLTRSQYWVLAHLARSEGPARQSEIAEALSVGKVTLGGLVDRLEASGLVRRESSPTDRRVRYVRLTARGRKAAAVTDEVRPQVDELMLEGMAPAQREQARQLLERMRSNLLAVLTPRREAS